MFQISEDGRDTGAHISISMELFQLSELDAGLSYGQEWTRGDIIGCMIDMDLGTISFARNGQSLGQAFAHIRQLEYFPAASLSYGNKTGFCCIEEV